MTANEASDGVSLREQILEIIKGYEPVAHSDGKGGTVENGYDLMKDERTEYGFYWEYEDMEECATKIMSLICHHDQRIIAEAESERSERDNIAYMLGYNDALENKKARVTAQQDGQGEQKGGEE